MRSPQVDETLEKSKSERPCARTHSESRQLGIPRRGMCRRGVLAASSLLLALFLVTAAWGGDPSFVPGAPIPLGGPSVWIATADFNGDAKTDIVAENREGKVAILLGDGLGRFAEAAGSPVAGRRGAVRRRSRRLRRRRKHRPCRRKHQLRGSFYPPRGRRRRLWRASRLAHRVGRPPSRHHRGRSER